MNMHSIPRAAERRSLGILVKSRVQSRVVYVDLIDISEGGCKVRGPNGFAKVGDRIVMRVRNVNAPLGIVAWVDGKFAGVSFEGQMHSAIIDYLVEGKSVPFVPEQVELPRRV